MEIEFHGRLEEKVIQQAVKLMSKVPYWMIALRVVFVILILVALGGFFSSFFFGDPFSETRILRNTVQILALGYFVVQPYIASRQLLRKLSAGRQTLTGVLTPVGVISNVGSSSRTIEYPWSGFYHLYKADDLIVLSTADSRISILSSALFKNKQDWNNFLEYVDSRVQPVK